MTLALGIGSPVKTAALDIANIVYLCHILYRLRWSFHAATLLSLTQCGDCVQLYTVIFLTMVTTTDRELYRRDVISGGHELSTEDRERLVKPYLPPIPEPSSTANTSSKRSGVQPRRKLRRKPIRSFLKSRLHVLIYFVVHLIFGIYIRLRHTYHAVLDRILALLYYHHRTPELIHRDVRNLSRLPEHLSVILTLKGEEDGGLEALMEDVAELSAWCACAGIPVLSVYERSGMHDQNRELF